MQKQSSISKGGVAAVLNKETLRSEHLAFLRWDAVWFELERHKRTRRITISSLDGRIAIPAGHFVVV